MTEISLTAPSQSLWDVLLGYIASALGRPVRPAPSLPQEMTPLLAIGRGVLGATELRDVDRRLDDAVMRFGEAMKAGQLRLPEDTHARLEAMLGAEPPPEAPPEHGLVRAALGAAVGRKMGRAIRLLWEQISAILAAMKDPDEARRAASMAWISLDPWSLHRGKLVPLEVMRAVSANARGQAALLGLMAACLDERRPEPWLVNALADRAMEGLGHGLRLYASLPTSSTAPGLIPPSERLDLAALQAEAEAADAAILAELTRQVESGALQGLDEDD